ncbi:cytoskeleton-associated protein 2-like isoform X2 [Lepus europaeus]|uniref:cytoskeleton-associated protein 2-like isoform X2 n=1 Tax=Lepus europaeus TaxID=9983 RepID=UPI002B49DDEE|nr:cytoskeleton-associated protein 2-like isoform X2 [Lepus europaeus]
MFRTVAVRGLVLSAPSRRCSVRTRRTDSSYAAQAGRRALFGFETHGLAGTDPGGRPGSSRQPQRRPRLSAPIGPFNSGRHQWAEAAPALSEARAGARSGLRESEPLRADAHPPTAAAMSTPAVPRDLQLPPSQRAQSAFREQRRQKFKEHLLRRKTFCSYKQENQTLSSCGEQTIMTSEDQVQKGTKALNLKTKMADKENLNRPTGNKTTTVDKSYVPLKLSNELNNSTTVIDAKNFGDDNQAIQLLSIKEDPQSQHMTLSQAFHLKNNNKKKPVTAEKPKQDANMPKKPVLGAYRGQIVQSKINSFRKPLQVKDASLTTTKLATTVSKATKPQPINTSSETVKSEQPSNMTAATKSVRATSQNTQLVRPPIRSHHDNTQNTGKQSISRTLANVTIRKGPREKELLQSKTTLSSIKTASQDIKRNKALSRGIVSEMVAKPTSSSNTKLVEKSKPVDQQRPTITTATVSSRSGQPKETAEQRKARLSEWKAGKGRVLKRPSNPVVQQPEPEGQAEKPVGSFWTTMAEEDEQRLFTEKVNKTISECLNLITEGCPKEEILITLNDLIKNIPDATKLVKYWICLARIEPITSPIENIIAIYEKAILAGAQFRSSSLLWPEKAIENGPSPSAPAPAWETRRSS